jgi:acyl-CoA synthetase (NDP forming)
VRSLRVSTPAEADEKAELLVAGGIQIALKILSDDIPHKSEVGVVFINPASRTAVEVIDDRAVALPPADLEPLALT